MRPALFMLLAATVTALALASAPAPAATEPTESALRALPLALQNHQNTPPQSSATAVPAHAATLQTVALTAPLATPASAAKDEPVSLWQAVSTVAVTLALIGAIAIRRHQAGKS
jgi:Tfp pilus assembly protein PilX